jgi:hypothetical protein
MSHWHATNYTRSYSTHQQDLTRWSSTPSATAGVCASATISPEYIHLGIRHLWDELTDGPRWEEEIEVRLWNIKCDPYDALPCLKCGINVCEVYPRPSIFSTQPDLPLNLLQECRYVPRVRDAPRFHSRRRPHLDEDFASHTLVCYCATCDEKVQSTLPLRLSETYDCDQYTRWIRHTCRWKEEEEDREYYKTSTVQIWEDDPPNRIPRGLWLGIRIFIGRYVWGYFHWLRLECSRCW